MFTLDNKPGKLAEAIQWARELAEVLGFKHICTPVSYTHQMCIRDRVGDPAAEKTAALLRELNHVCRTVRLLGVYTK